jgi:uncharacterized protein (UPF0261 family)
MATVALLGTLDTKGDEYAWIAQQLGADGVDTILVDTGTYSDAPLADISSTEVASAAGRDLGGLREEHDRGVAMDVMGQGAAAVLLRLLEEGGLDGVLAVGGSSGSSVAAVAMQALPIGVPKLLVSTMASGDVSPYVGAVDTAIMYSVVDIAGINSLSERVLGNAAAAIAGMAQHYAATKQAAAQDNKLVGLTMFGLTTPAADEAREVLTEAGYEVLVFHATGAGGTAMEKLASSSGMLVGVCDLTTTELADDLVGGVLSAGPRRLEAAGLAGVPQVVSVGALDMVNFGPKESVPDRFDGRNFVVHNPTVTLMRTSADEMGELGRRIADKLRTAPGPVTVFLPLGGVSGIDEEGGPFWDPDADAACFDAIRSGLDGSGVEVVELDQNVNTPGFGQAMAERLLQSMGSDR